MQARRSTPLLLISIVIIAVGMAMVGFFWLGGPSAPPAPPVAASAAKPAPQKTASSAPIKAPSAPNDTAAVQPADAPPPPTVPRMEAAPTTAEQRAREEADMKIGTLLAQNPTVEGARDKLLVLFPSLTPYEKIAAAPHINNLTGDDKLRSVVDFLKSPNTPAEAQETFFNDMLNRPPQVGWPVLIEVIGTPNHPMAQRAKELLTTIVGQDHGNDLFAWQRALHDQLVSQGAITEDAATAASNAPPTGDPAPAPQQQQ